MKRKLPNLSRGYLVLRMFRLILRGVPVACRLAAVFALILHAGVVKATIRQRVLVAVLLGKIFVVEVACLIVLQARYAMRGAVLVPVLQVLRISVRTARA